MFITFEGIEGAGKTTQIRLLADRLERSGRPVVVTREPGDGPLGPDLRRLVLTPPGGATVDERTELMLMLADRAQHVAFVIRPALAAGSTVICDRYADSSVAYQGAGRGLDEHFVRAANHFVTGGLVPDITVLLDLDASTGLARQTDRNRMEEETLAFHGRVRAGFQKLAESEPARFVVVDGGRPQDVIQTEIWRAVEPRLKP
jgi:dTMP kinase